MIYAGFWRRFLAHIVDAVLISTIITIPLVVGGLALGFSAGMDAVDEMKAEQHSSAFIIQPTSNDYTTAYPESSAPASTPASQMPDPSSPSVNAPTVEPVPYDGEGHQSVVAPTEVGSKEKDAAATAIAALFYPLLFLVGTIYHTAFVGSKMQSTPGKRLLGCMVVKTDGSRISYLHAFGRHLACAVSVLTLYIGFFIIGWTKQKTGLHDLIAGTRVVRIKPAPIAIATPEEL